jgi:CheY-like chemotaxis protein
VAGDGKRAVLLVDDDRMVRDSLTFVIGDGGYEVLPAATVAAALELYETKRPDMVVTDLQMAGASGAGLIAELRARNPATPIIAMSGALADGANTPEESATLVGANAFLEKPFRPSMLLREIGRLLGG